MARLGIAGAIFAWTTTSFWLLVLIVLPQLAMAEFAFRPFLPPRDWGGPKDVLTTANFAIVLGDAFNRAIFARTILASLFVTVLALVVCYPVAFILARARESGWARVVMLALLLPFWVNEVLRAFAWQLLLAHQGLFNTILVGAGLFAEPFDFINANYGVVIGLVYAYMLFMIFPIYGAVDTLDWSQIEAARDLGAPGWRVHWDIVIPHAKAGIASGCIATFMLAAGSFAIPQLLGGTRSLWFTQLIYNQFEAINWNEGAAYALCLVVLCLGFVLATMRLFRVGVRDIAR
jgi:spermidine/putrescine transport system permease protein